MTLLPNVAMAADNESERPAMSDTCGAEGNESNVTWTFENGTLTISGTGAMKNFTANSQKDERPWKDYISSITKGIVTHGVTNVGDRTFYNCSNMASVELADGITSITGGAFENCTSLTSLALPNSLEKFGGNAFKGCTGLTGELVIPDSVREIKNWAFMNCTSISSVSIGKNVESISASAFQNCKSLKNVTFRGATKNIGSNAFRATSLTSLTFPDGLETIGADAFYGIATLSGMLVIPDSVTKIENQAFWTGRTNGEGSKSNISGIRVDSPKIHIGNSAFKATGADYIDLTRVDELSSWGNWVLDENEICIIYAKSDSVLGKVKNSQHVTNYIYAFTSGGIFAENTVFLTDTLATPVKDGYAFTGWYTDEACTNKLDTTPAANSTYYAKWEEAAASVNGVGYTTLGAAITAAQDGDTIMLLKDVTENVTIPAGKTITLDLNGKNIAVTSGCAIVNKGTLTVTGSGNVTTSANGSAAVANFPDAIATLNGGTYSSSNWYVIKNLGTMTIDGHVTVKKPDGSTDTSSLIDNGWVSNEDTVAGETVAAQADKAKLTIKNGAFEGKSGSASCSVVKNDDYGVLEITGGTFDSTNNVETSNATTILNWNVATISGGTFKGSYPISNGSYDNDADQGLLTISGGDFIGTSSLFGQAQGGTSGAGKVTITDGSFKAPQFGAFNYALEITGGTFSFDPSTKVKNNGTDYIVKRAGSEGAYTYTVLAKSGLTSGVYLTDPSGALANNYYVSSTANGLWTVSYSAPYSGGSSSYDPTYSVSTPSKTENGSVTVSPKSASKGDTVTVTVKPDSGYVLETLTVTDKNGNELTLKDKGDGKYTFTMPAGKVEVKATFMEDNSVLNFFYDVPNDAYFYEAVKWAVKNSITTGVGNDLFAPEQPCTRAQIVTFLWRAAGSPEPKGAASGMTDVVSGSYYEKAVAWAIENGITTGTTATTFSPDATCTRGQSVTFLYRAMGTAPTTVNGFTDVAADSFCADAVAWAVENGVTNGTSASAFSPSNGCTRAQIVTFLFRAYQGK